MDKRKLLVLSLTWLQLVIYFYSNSFVVNASTYYNGLGDFEVVNCVTGGNVNNVALVSESMTKVKSELVKAKKAADEAAFYSYKEVAIDTNVFNATSVRLNTEIYNETADILDKRHIQNDYGESGTPLYNSYLQYINPLVPLSLTICETGMWADTRYTWSSAVYSKLLKNSGVNMEKLKVERINVDTYVVNGLCTYLGCGSNCASDVSHYHVIGNNDNDSLGPLQILRRYVDSKGCIKYKCGEFTEDLMCWKDNVEYFMHRQSEAFSDSENWNRDHAIKSETELVALMAVAHNTGSAYVKSKSAGSLWRNSEAVYDYCEVLGSEHAFRVLSKYIEEWYEDAKKKEENGESFVMAGTALSNKYNEMLNEIGVNKSKYANGWSHKQYYPLKAVLNYMAIERLYFSGMEVESYG